MFKAIVKTIGWFFLIGIILIILWLSVVFGPVFHVNYNHCMDSREDKIIDNIRLYEKIYEMKDNSKYDKPFLCIETHKNDTLCHLNMELGKYKLKEIYAKKVYLTGRVVKQYAFNAFNNDMYTLEVMINDRKYFISHYAYDDMTIKHSEFELNKAFKEPTCSLF